MTNDDAIRRLVDDPEAQPRIIRLRPGRMLRLTDEHGVTTGSLYYAEDAVILALEHGVVRCELEANRGEPGSADD